MGLFDGLKPKKSLSELEEESQRLDAEYTVAQKRAMIKQLKDRGLQKKNFPSWDSIYKWLRTH